MPILVILFLTATCLPVEWPEPLLGAAGELTAGFVAAALLASTTLSAWVSRNAGRSFAAGVYSRWRRRLFFVNVFGTAACIAVGWGWTVQTEFAVSPRPNPAVAPFAELLIPGPYLLVVMANWFVYYFAERALHRASAGERGERFWSLPAFVFFNARQFALIFLLPLLLMTGRRAGELYAPEAARAWWYQLASFAALLLLFVFLPLLARPVLGLRRMPAGPIRDRLLATAARLGFRSPLLFWPTRNAVANAVILGMVPPARFVAFTDKLLDTLRPDELDAVFGHEVGHARHLHLPYYAGFLLLSVTAIALALTAATALAFGPDWDLPGGWGPFALLGLLAGYLFVAFGFLSRTCERQADLAGARAVSCGDPACAWHSTDTVLSVGRGPVCGTGARTMARALERVVLSGTETEQRGRWRRLGEWVKAWQHGPATGRVEFLHRVAERPPLADRHDRFAFRVRVGLAAALVAVVVVSGSVIGWELVWKML